MPAAVTHYLHAQRVQKEQGMPQCDQDALLWGAQGPDFFYCHRFLPWQQGASLAKFGDCLHRDTPGRLLSAMQDFAAKNRDQVTLSYIVGFLCHYSADRTCHPFVCCQARRLLQEHPEQDEAVFHNQVESALDVILLRYETARLPTEFSLKKTVPKNRIVQEKVALLYSDVLQRVYGAAPAHEQLRQALDDTRRLYGMMSDRTTLKKPILRRWERSHGGKYRYSSYLRGVSEEDDFDYANILLEPWGEENQEKPRDDSFFDLYEKAVLEAAALIRAFFAGGDWKALVGERPFL